MILYKIVRIPTTIEVKDHEARALFRIFPADSDMFRIYKDEEEELEKLKNEFPNLYDKISALLEKEEKDFIELSDEA